MNQDKQYFLILEDIALTFGKDKIIIFKKGDVCEFLGPSQLKNGYILAKKLDCSDVHEIPYAPAFVRFLGTDLEAIKTLYEGEHEIY